MKRYNYTDYRGDLSYHSVPGLREISSVSAAVA